MRRSLAVRGSFEVPPAGRGNCRATCLFLLAQCALRRRISQAAPAKCRGAPWQRRRSAPHPFKHALSPLSRDCRMNEHAQTICRTEGKRATSPTWGGRGHHRNPSPPPPKPSRACSIYLPSLGSDGSSLIGFSEQLYPACGTPHARSALDAGSGQLPALLPAGKKPLG